MTAEQNMEKEKATESRTRPTRKLRGGKEVLTAYIEPELADKLRVRCALDRLYLSDAVRIALKKWLD
jgi:hypothetical protein